MKKTIFLLALFATLSSGYLLAQPALQVSVVPDIGDVTTIQEADTNNVSPGNAGANQTWNFSNLQPLSGSPATQYIYLSPIQTPYGSTFPMANLAVKIEFDTVVYGYARKETNQYSLLGIKNNFVEQVYPDPDIQLKNLLYGGSFSDDFANYTDAGTGIVFYAEGSRTVTYDGYGTLMTPLGTFSNAMRIKSVSSQVDSANFFGIVYINRTDIRTYDWFVPGQPGVFVSVYYTHTISETYFTPGAPPIISDFGTTKSANYLSSLSIGTVNRPDELAGVSVSFAGPNPATDELALNITTEKGQDLHLLLTNVEGKEFGARSLTLASGENRVSLPVSHLPAGAYFATLTDGRNVRTLNWQKH